jgi:hypothetical protein
MRGSTGEMRAPSARRLLVQFVLVVQVQRLRRNLLCNSWRRGEPGIYADEMRWGELCDLPSLQGGQACLGAGRALGGRKKGQGKLSVLARVSKLNSGAGAGAVGCAGMGVEALAWLGRWAGFWQAPTWYAYATPSANS